MWPVSSKSDNGERVHNQGGGKGERRAGGISRKNSNAIRRLIIYLASSIQMGKGSKLWGKVLWEGGWILKRTQRTNATA